MPFFVGNPAADEAFLATLFTRMSKIVDLVSGERAAIGAFARNGGIARLPASHTFIQPLLMQESGNLDWFRGLDPVGKSYTPGTIAAEYGHAYASIPIRYEFTTLVENEGPDKIADIYTSRLQHARITMLNQLANAFINGTGGKQPTGFAKAIEAAAPASQVEVVGSISKAANPFWRNKYLELGSAVAEIAVGAPGDSFGSDLGVAGRYSSAGMELLSSTFLRCCVGNRTPSFCFVRPLTEEMIFKTVNLNHELRSTGKLDDSVDGSFSRFSLFGKPVIAEANLPAQSGFWLTLANEGLNGNFRNRTGPSEDGELDPSRLGGMYSGYHPSVNMRITPPREIADSHGQYIFCLSSMQNVFESMAQQGRFGANTAAGSTIEAF